MEAQNEIMLLKELVLAAKQDVSFTRMARDAHINRHVITDLIAKNTIGFENGMRLHKWLAKNGYLEETIEDSGEDIFHAVADDLEGLASQLRAPIPREVKQDILILRIKQYVEHAAAYK